VLSGFAFTAFYFIYQMRGPGKRNLLIELGIGGISSVLLGVGTLFTMLGFGMYP